MAENGRAGRVSPLELFAYSLPGLPIAALGLPLAVHLPNFYAVEMGFGYALAGSVFLLTRVLDIFFDPMVGVASDHLHTKWGRRRVWMAASVPLMIVTSIMLFMPSPGVSWVTTVTALVFLFVGWSMLTVTHLALGGEISPDYHERARITAAREAVLVAGSFLVLLLPVLIQAQGGDRFAQIEAFGWFVIATLPTTVLVAWLFLKERPVPKVPPLDWRTALRAMAVNRPLAYVLVCDFVGGLSTGTVATLFIAMATVGLGLGQSANILLLVYFAMGVVFIPPMVWLSKRLGKHQTLALSSLVNAILIPCIFLLPQGAFWPAAALWTVFGANMSVGPFLFRAIMADVADHDEVETGQARAGVYFSLLALTNKAGYSVAIGLTFWTLALIGFQEKAVNPPETVSAMMMLYIIPPTLASLLIAAVMWRFPLDEARQLELRRIIEERSAAGTALGAGVGHTLEDEPDLPKGAGSKPAE